MTARAVKPNRHALPSGAWVEMRDPMEVTHGEFRTAVAAMDGGTSKAEAAVALLTTAWSYESPPGDLEALDRLPRPDVGALLQLATPAVTLLWPDFAVSPDHSSPTSPSSD